MVPEPGTLPEEGAVSFLYYGDAQYGILSHAARIFRQGLLSAPEARFVLHAGDLVNKGDRDLEWGEWFQGKRLHTRDDPGCAGGRQS